ncbi:MAG: acyl-CoA reductase [Bacteroidia bacterium]|nr:acyl-CoA reductase [Bacteroidia bacterium]
MKLEQRISAFSELGETLRDTIAGKQTSYTSRIEQLIENQHHNNPWFTPDNVRMAVSAIAEELTSGNLNRWCNAYPGLDKKIKPLNVGVVMPGNIPLAGFHDFLSVLISGNRIIAKKSSKDPDLINLISEILVSADPEFKNLISITDENLTGFDVVIATGSDNSARYFEYYFGKYPHIIRNNRNSIAIIDGKENDNELEALGTDVFSYFGLGCRNVSRLFLPAGYDLSVLTRCWNSYSGLVRHKKYASNYDFSKAVFIVNREKFTDTGYLLMKEHNSISSPVAVLHYGFYKIPEEFKIQIFQLKDKIQCIIGHDYIPFGKAQMPALWDYADSIDTIDFLLKINSTRIL